MALTIGHDPARAAFAESVSAFVAVVDDASEWDLLGASRCHGWARIDVVAHLLAGWQELLGGLFVRTEEPATVDAASYWTGFARDHVGADPVVTAMAQRRRGSAYLRPESARTQLRDVADTVLAGLDGVVEGRHRFQGFVLTAGDLLATWAVENAVHHLDLLLPGEPPSAALTLARRTVEALAGPLPAAWSERDAVLIGTGRAEPPPGTDDDLRSRLPAFG